MKIAVVGTGYVGLVTGVVLAELGNDVVCVDKDPVKIALLRRGEPPIYEPGIEELLKRGIAEERLRFTDDTAEAVKASEIVFIAVGTPPAEDGTPDLTAVKAVARAIGGAIDKYTVVVNKSTVPVGSGDMVEKLICEEGCDPALFDVVSNPEFLREGSAIADTLKPDRIVIGSKNKVAADKLVQLYQELGAPMIVTDLESAELIKYGANAFLAMKISFINAMSRVCELCGADVSDVSKGMGADQRIGPQFLSAGLGWGGSCFPKDVQGMVKTAERLGYDFGLLKEVITINDEQTTHFVQKLEKRLGGFQGKTVGLMGLAFKPNTDDIRDAKSLVIIDAVLKGGGKVRAYDPVAAENVKEIYPDLDYVHGADEVAEGSDALVMVTEWNEFRGVDLADLAKRTKGRLLFDGRRLYGRQRAEAAGFEYHTIGSQ